jgi:hypothetical protein
MSREEKKFPRPSLQSSAWTKLLSRRTTVPPSPERGVAIAVVVNALLGDDGDVDETTGEPMVFARGGFDRGTTPWLWLLDIDPDEFYRDAVVAREFLFAAAQSVPQSG